MLKTQVTGWCFFVLLAANCVFALPNQYRPREIVASQRLVEPQRVSAARVEEINRKFAEKPNALKKVALDDIDDDIQTNQIQETGLGFSWTNMLGTMLQMLFPGGGNNSPTKSDDIDNNVGFTQSPWTNLLSVGLKILTAILGGGQNNDGIDKVDNGGGGSPMQGILAAVLSTMLGAKDPEQVNTMAKQAGEFINIVMNLLDALKTSFSHRSIRARSIGKKDSVSDAAVAGLSMLKSYVKTYKNSEDKCMQKYLCEANSECNADIGGTSIFCQLGTYATSFVLERTTSTAFETFYEAGRQGRSGVDCRQLYLECNEV
ncbi:uncharacterized protein LOC129803676 isoform X1 [Phlebotomus papatasi]|uniref:uncharacterized protein LOC129803676 isoform X1 n=1 Tax=Phlebotomus papatasi TaxID=29031 RepID=UPI0024842714|nr:uncharacterized protein LOC129803676 isoform X1 [Phlebotomus papatasi]